MANGSDNNRNGLIHQTTKQPFILFLVLLCIVLSAQAQNTPVCQPDSVLVYYNTDEYPNHAPTAWMKFTYDQDGLLVHFRQEAFSDVLWSIIDIDYHNDQTNHCLMLKNTLMDSYDAMHGFEYKTSYAYNEGHKLSTMANYIFDHSSPTLWQCLDSVSYLYGPNGELLTTTNHVKNVTTTNEYIGNKTVITTEHITENDTSLLSRLTKVYSNEGKLLSCRRELTNSTYLTTYDYNDNGFFSGILMQELLNNEYIPVARVVFELNEDGYPTVVHFEKWEEEWIESGPPITNDYCIYFDDYLKSQNSQLCITKVKRMEIHYTNTPMPDYEIKEKEDPSHIVVQPNPTNQTFTVQGCNLTKIEVYNTLGNLVLLHQLHGDSSTIDLSSQPAGLYFVSVTDKEGKCWVKKVVKQ